MYTREEDVDKSVENGKKKELETRRVNNNNINSWLFVMVYENVTLTVERTPPHTTAQRPSHTGDEVVECVACGRMMCEFPSSAWELRRRYTKHTRTHSPKSQINKTEKTTNSLERCYFRAPRNETADFENKGIFLWIRTNWSFLRSLSLARPTIPPSLCHKLQLRKTLTPIGHWHHMRSTPILNVFDTEKQISNTHFGLFCFRLLRAHLNRVVQATRAQ